MGAALSIRASFHIHASFYIGVSFLLLAYRLPWTLTLRYLLCTSSCVAPSGVGRCNGGCCGYISCDCEGRSGVSLFLFLLSVVFYCSPYWPSTAVFWALAGCAVVDGAGSVVWWKGKSYSHSSFGALYVQSWWSVRLDNYGQIIIINSIASVSRV